MRVSVEKDDPGYTVNTRNVLIALNELLIDNVITADDTLGYIKRYKTDASGNVMLDSTSDDLIVEEVYGKVSILR